MKDLKFDNITGDLDLSTGDIQFVTGIQAIGQLIATRFRFQRGEWFLDRRVGSPIFDDGKGPSILGANRGDLETIRAICQQILEGTPGVTRVVSLDFDLDENRALSVTWQVEGTTGEFLAGTESLIFGDL